MGAAQLLKLSVEEYLALDRAAEVKSEYHDGEVFPVENATVRHGRIGANTGRRISERLDSKPCWVTNPVRIRVSPTKYLYPDLMVVCGDASLTDEHADTLTNPKLLVEILSPSTEDYSYGRKFALYRLLPTLEEYVLIAQSEPRVDVFRKTPDNRWVLSTCQGWESVAKLESLEIELPLAEVYRGLE